MKEFIYPASFHKNSDASFTVTFPDLPGCITEGKSLGKAMQMAQSALTQWVDYLHDEKEPIPAPSSFSDLKVNGDEIISFIQASTKDTRAVKRTVSLPKWMDDKVSEVGFSLSKLLQEAVQKKLDMIKA